MGDASRVGVFFSSLVPRENAKFNPLLLSVGKRRHFAYEVLHTKKECVILTHSLFSRKEATRTPDPYVPNVVRYQLRYFPILVVQR